MLHFEHPIYLASRSPRRRELLDQIGVRYAPLLFRSGEREDPETNEDRLPGEPPRDYVLRVARAKALAGVQRASQRGLAARPVLGADTTVTLGDDIFGKPASPHEAAAVLRRLSDNVHQVLTAVVLATGGRVLEALSVTDVHFRSLTNDDIVHYVASGEPMDKAGAYGIQGHAGAFVREIRGSYTGVMGLPVFETAELLRQLGRWVRNTPAA